MNGEIPANDRYDDAAKTWTLYKGTYSDQQLAQARDLPGANHIEGQGRTPGTILYTTFDNDLIAHTSGSALEVISPIKQVRQVSAPVLLIHAKDDTVVPIEQSLSMKGALSAANKPVEMVTLEGEDHWLSLAKTRTAMLEAAVSFVQKHNPAESPSN